MPFNAPAKLPGSREYFDAKIDAEQHEKLTTGEGA